MSTPEERFALAKQAYTDAFDAWDDDLDDCKGDAAAMRKVNANLRTLHTEMLKAANAWLGATGAAVEAAYDAATDAKKAVDQAREDDMAIAERLGKFLDLSDSVKTLIEKAKATPPPAP